MGHCAQENKGRRVSDFNEAVSFHGWGVAPRRSPRSCDLKKLTGPLTGSTVPLPYSSGTMIPNRPSSFRPFMVSGGILLSWSILAESTRDHKEETLIIKRDGDMKQRLSAFISSVTFFTEESFHRCNELLDLLQLFVSNLWVRKDFILEGRRATIKSK